MSASFVRTNEHDAFIDRRLRGFAIERYGRHGSMSLHDLRDSDEFRRISGQNLDFLLRNRDSVLDWLDASLGGRDSRSRGETLAFSSGTWPGPSPGKTSSSPWDQPNGMASPHSTNTSLLASAPHSSHMMISPVSRSEWSGRSPHTSAIWRDSRIVWLSRTPARPGTAARRCAAGIRPRFSSTFSASIPERLRSRFSISAAANGRALVRHLRSFGKRAFGVDRLAATGDFIARADWFDFPLGRLCWGDGHLPHGILQSLPPSPSARQRQPRTVRPPLHGDTRCPRARRIVRLHPGAPFIEEILPRGRWTVVRRSLPEVSGSAADVSLARLLGESVFYSCRVTRIP